MRIAFLELPLAERRVYIEQAAIRRDMSPVILEKDFWVSWLLSVLFQSDFSDALVFKGGTSLSKVFGIIDRFSEDIDLSLSPAFLNLPEAASSRNQANKWMKKAEQTCGVVVREQISPYLAKAIASVLGEGTEWIEYVTDAHTQSPVLLFHYPTTQPPGFEYLKRSIKLEFGSLTDQRPVGRHQVRPWIADVFPETFSDWQCDVIAMEIERSFWEKATILHAEFHRPREKPILDRFSRHYADTAALALHPDTEKAIGMVNLRDRVVEWKSLYFGSSWAKYDEAKPGTFRLVPPEWRQAELRRDYLDMGDMYLSKPMTFDEIQDQLANLEKRING